MEVGPIQALNDDASSWPQTWTWPSSQLERTLYVGKSKCAPSSRIEMSRAPTLHPSKFVATYPISLHNTSKYIHDNNHRIRKGLEELLETR